MSSKKRENRRFGPNGKQLEISSQIRCDIKNGRYQPGDKLASREELRDIYKAGPVTIQNAFDKLIEDGFVRSAGKRGTFVLDHPSCFCNYAVVFPHNLSRRSPEVNFYKILADLAGNDTRREDCRFTIYTGVTGHEDDPDYIRLYKDINNECIAGVIFVVNVSQLSHTPLYKEICSREEIMKVGLDSDGYNCDLTPRITLESDGIVDKIFDFLEKKNVKRLAVISALIGHSPDDKVPNEDYIFSESKRRGIELKRSNFQVRFPDLASRTRGLAELIFCRSSHERPDGLWIMTDSLVKAATLGVLDAGVNVPEDLTVISHCNFPKQPDAKVETSWYGADVLEFIDKALAIMHHQRDGNTEEISSVVPVKFCLR